MKPTRLLLAFLALALCLGCSGQLLGCLPTSAMLSKLPRVVPLPVSEGLETVSAARIDFTGLNVETTAEGAEFIIDLAHPISTLDCFPTVNDATTYFAAISFAPMHGRRTIDQLWLYSDGEVLIRGKYDRQKETTDEQDVDALRWQEDSEGRIRLKVPWRLIPNDQSPPPLGQKQTKGLMVDVFSRRVHVSKLMSDTWEALNQRYGGKFTLDGSDGELSIRSNQLLAGTEPLEGVLGHLPELCRRGSTQGTFDMVPGRGPTVSKKFDDRDLLWALSADTAIVLKKP